MGYVKQTKWEYSGTKKQLYVYLEKQKTETLKYACEKSPNSGGKKATSLL